ncbi:hypothetical protein [Pseudomonas tolaasii]|uniref:hypothetical protein n=1 Tax=Pseudomonas tolaasii TaxID=29442 RepID=UPI0002D2F842|nr:hypothetical protein [Pseudomonas tolaasii]
MKNPIDICRQNLNIIYELLKTLLDQIGDKPLARQDREAFSNFEINYKNFVSRSSASKPDVEAAVSSANGAAIHAQVLGMTVSERGYYSDEIKSTARVLQERATSLREVIDSSEEFSVPYVLSIDKNTEAGLPNDSISSSEKYIIELRAKFRSEIETFERDIAKGNDEIEELKRKSLENSQKSIDELSDLRRSIEQLKSEVFDLQNNMTEEVGKAAKIAQDAEVRSNEVDTQINGLLGQNASKILLIDYANTAEAEGRSANFLRRWSLLCMALTGVVLCLALYESLNSGLDWKQAIFKVFTAIALSVPAAYLARESAKHRNQEHVNRRISLDLRAITPYIATLPSEEQNKIKSEVASRIFGMQENTGGSSDSYPINFQELAKMMFEKIPTPK